jgi:protein-tyrosine phosphatase
MRIDYLCPMNTEAQTSTEFLLKSQLNFRDLGGIKAKEGKKIKPGLIYRSGDLHSISDEDILKLEEIGLATIIDFRSERERTWRPDTIIRTVRQTLNITIPDAVRDLATEYLEQNNLPGLESLLVSEYRNMVNRHRHEFGEFLEVLATTDHLPLVFHCAAGKDRTGLASIFLLKALGVSWNVILDDYFSTNRYNEYYTEKMIVKINGKGLNGDLMRPMLEVRPEYLDAALDEIEVHFGGLDSYVRNTLKAEVEKLQKRFLE